MKRNSLIEKTRNEIMEDIKREVDLSFEISDRISEILTKQNKTQRDLAKSLHKSEAEVSKWMHGTHNFTIHTIAKIEMVLGENIISVPKMEKVGSFSLESISVAPHPQYKPVLCEKSFSWTGFSLKSSNSISKFNC